MKRVEASRRTSGSGAISATVSGTSGAPARRSRAWDASCAARRSIERRPGAVSSSRGFSTPSHCWKRNSQPRALLERLLQIERELGRVRRERWGPRAIDLDLLIFDDLEIDEAGLSVPHPRMRERAFVLVPLAEIDDRFAPLRDALQAEELAGVARVERESVAEMPEEDTFHKRARTRARTFSRRERRGSRASRGP